MEIYDWLREFSKLNRQYERLDKEKEELNKKNSALNEEKEKIRKELENGKLSEDQFLAYCFYKFDLNVLNMIPVVKKFTSELKKYEGQKILIYKAGGTAYSTAIGRNSYPVEKDILIGRLVKPCYSFEKNTNLVAVVDNLSAGWDVEKGFVLCVNKFYLDRFPRGYRCYPRIISAIISPKTKKLAGIVPDDFQDFKEKNSGFTINIHKPIENIHNLPIGGHIEYDSDVISSLVVGNGRVDKYLNVLNLSTIKREKVSIPEI